MSDRDDDGEALPTVRRCAADRVHQRLLLTDAGYSQRRSAIENQAWRAARMPALARSGCTRIPVVVHVVHRTDAENVSQAQIDSQITVLNADFRRRNPDIAAVPAPFRPLIGDARIEFALATTDPAGSPTTGVTRTRTVVNGFTDDDLVKAAATGGADAWPADRYLNIWVCRLAGGLLGYAQFPGGPAATDGVVITHTGFGTVGTASAPFNLGRTTVHEIGHWLNLLHVWGDDGTGCSGSDFVDDTPNQGGANTGVPAFPSVSCGNGPNGDLFVNYMDYTDDVGMVMFTAGQVVRMQATLDGPRAGIGTAIPCGGVKAKFADDPVTLKFSDDPIGTSKLRDDPIGTVKFRDDPGSIKVLDDPIGTSKLRDDPVSLKFSDDPIGTSKTFDDVKSPALDKQPLADAGLPRGPFGSPFAGTGRGVPFVLSTPHHSSAWQETFPDSPEAIVAAYEAKLTEYEQTFEACAVAEGAGELTDVERERVNELYAEYTALVGEFRQLTGAARHAT